MGSVAGYSVTGAWSDADKSAAPAPEHHRVNGGVRRHRMSEASIEERWVTVDGTNIRYLEVGNGPEVIMLHGAQTYLSADIFTDVMGPVAGWRLPGDRVRPARLRSVRPSTGLHGLVPHHIRHEN